jgi:molybdenum cofactor cytidylyltransferase
MINAIVLAAGESKRMGMPKPLLLFPRSMGVPPMSLRGILPLHSPLQTNPGPILEPGAFGTGSVTLCNRPLLHGQDAHGAHGRDGRATHGRDAHATKSGDTTFLEQIVSVLRRSEVGRITVVLGAEAARIRASIDLSGVDIIVNEDYRKGQLSSLMAGLQSVPSQTEAILLCLVDNPLITGATVNRLVQAFHETDRPIVIPVFEGRRGHPALFARAMFEELLVAPADEGARYVVQSHKDQVFEVDIPEPAILARIDTPEDYLSRFGVAPRIIER